MHMELPAKWAAKTIDLPLGSVVEGADQSALRRVFADALHITGCAAAIVCRRCEGKLAIVAAAENGPLEKIVPVVLDADPSSYTDILVAQSVDTASALTIGFPTGDGATVRFAAAARIECKEDTLLIATEM